MTFLKPHYGALQPRGQDEEIRFPFWIALAAVIAIGIISAILYVVHVLGNIQ